DCWRATDYSAVMAAAEASASRCGQPTGARYETAGRWPDRSGADHLHTGSSAAAASLHLAASGVVTGSLRPWSAHAQPYRRMLARACEMHGRREPPPIAQLSSSRHAIPDNQLAVPKFHFLATLRTGEQ